MTQTDNRVLKTDKLVTNLTMLLIHADQLQSYAAFIARDRRIRMQFRDQVQELEQAAKKANRAIQSIFREHPQLSLYEHQELSTQFDEGIRQRVMEVQKEVEENLNMANS